MAAVPAEDTLNIVASEHLSFLSSRLEKDEDFLKFARAVEEDRRDRMRRIEAGDESARLKFPSVVPEQKGAKKGKGKGKEEGKGKGKSAAPLAIRSPPAGPGRRAGDRDAAAAPAMADGPPSLPSPPPRRRRASAAPPPRLADAPLAATAPRLAPPSRASHAAGLAQGSCAARATGFGGPDRHEGVSRPRCARLAAAPPAASAGLAARRRASPPVSPPSRRRPMRGSTGPDPILWPAPSP